MLKVVILGYGQMLTHVIAGCLDANCKIVGVFRYDKVRYNTVDRLIHDTLVPSHEYNYIKGHKLYEIKARSANSAEFKKEILKLNADLVIVSTWGEKLKKHIISLPKIATINVHPSLLPKYRGPNPYLQAIVHGEKESGVTFHLMDEEFDTGAILRQKRVEIGEHDTGKELREKCANAARIGIRELVDELSEEVIIPVNQDEKISSYFPQITEDEVMLDFKKSAEEIYNRIRGFHPWYKCYFGYNTHFFIPNPYMTEILENKTEVNEAGKIVEKSWKTKSLTVVCGDGKLLKMSGILLFGTLNRLITSLYIRLSVKNNKKVY